MLDKMILIDLETQNFPVESGIYEVACLAVENYEIVDRLYLGKEIPEYTREKRYGFGFYDICEDEECINRFIEFLNRYPYPIVAHNCPFDRKFLVYYQWITEDYPTYCSMRAIRMADNTLESYALHNLVEHYKVANQVEHTAMSDIENVYKILKILKPQTWIPIGVKSSDRSSRGAKTKPRQLEQIDLNIDTTQMLTGENVCFTGTSKYPRKTMQEIAIKNGAEISDNITAITTILVVGLAAGSKLDKAQEKGISIISDEEFMQILNLSGKQIIAPVNPTIAKEIEIKERKSKFLPQSVFVEKKWYEFEPELWVNYKGEIDAEGIEWKPLWIIEEFQNAGGYYISSDYRLKKPNGNIVPMQKTILGRAFNPVHYAYLFMVDEYNRYIMDFINIYVYEKNSELSRAYYHRADFEHCCFFMEGKRPKTLEEVVESEVEKRFSRSNGMKITLFLDKQAKEEHEREEQALRETIRAKVLGELEKYNTKLKLLCK